MVTLPHARRLPAAVLIALAVSASVGTAFAANGERPAEYPAEIQLPAFRLGDRGSYVVHLEGNWDEVGGTTLPEAPYEEPRTAIVFEWSDAGIGQDGQGSQGPADLLKVQITRWDLNIFSDSQPWTLVNRTTEAYFRSGETQPYRTTAESEREGFTDPNSVLNVTLPGDRFGSASHWLEDDYEDPPVDCIVNLDFAGRPIPSQGTVRVSARPCESELGYYSPILMNLGSIDTPWVVKGWTEVDGVPLLHLDEQASVRINGQRTSVWLHPGVPVPVRYEVRRSVDNEETVARYELASFQSGNIERVPRRVWSGSWPAVEQAPRPAWGFDDSGLDLPFPAREAFLRLDGNATWREFVRQNPEAYVFGARTYSSEYYGQSSHLWSFAIGNGTAALYGQVEQTIPASLARLPRSVWQPAASYEVVAVEMDEGALTGMQMPPRQAVPERLPTAKAAEEGWHAAGGLGQANWAGFGFTHDLATRTWHAYVGAGWQHTQHHLADQKMASPEGVSKFNSLNSSADIAFIRADGDLASRLRHTWDTSDPDPLRIGEAEPVPQARSAPTPPGWWPTPVQAAGAGLLGLVAGLLYWVWPALRLGAIGLFSRVQGPALLDNQSRSRIMDAVASQPGIHFKELRRLTGIPNGALVHHLRKLTDSGILVAQRSGRYVCYFGRAVDAGQLRSVEAVKAAGARKLLEAVQREPGLGPEAIASRCGLAVSTVHYHMARLEQAGLLRVDRQGRDVRLVAIKS